MQENHDVANSLLFGPARGDLACAEFADAGNLPQFFGTGLDDFEGRFAENADDPIGELGTDASDHPGAEVFLDAFSRRRRGRLEHIGLELKAMRAIGEPDAHGMNEFARRDRSRMPDDRDEIAPPARFHLQDREAILLIMKSHPLDGADERFTRRSGVAGGLQNSMPFLDVAAQIISNTPSEALSIGPRSRKWGLPAEWRRFRPPCERRGRSNVCALIEDL
jgi:hypothetical protein